MKTAWSFTVLALLAVAAAIALNKAAGLPGFPPLLAMIGNSSIIVKLGEFVLALVLVLVVLVGLIQLAGAKDGARSGFLSVMTWIAGGIGVALLLFRALFTKVIMEVRPPTHVTPLQMVAIFLTEGVLALALGFAVAAVAAWINTAIVARGRKRKAVAAAA